MNQLTRSLNFFGYLAVGSILFCSEIQSAAQKGDVEGLRYKTGWGSVVKLGTELYGTLTPEAKKCVHSKPINVETDVTPTVRLEELKNEELTSPLATIFISAGFIDLVNNVAHAKAIDKIQKGYFEKYIASLSGENGEKELKELPGLSNPKFWTESMINEQLSNFNQMVGVVVGINLSHYYLGPYKKYESKLTETQGKSMAINSLLTQQEWDRALRYGVINALKCGYGVDGVLALFECIDKMPKRPAWTVFFVPDSVKASAAKREMKKLEDRFMRGEQL